MTIINGCPCHSRCGTLKNPYCSMTMSAEHSHSPVVVTSPYEWKLSSETINPQTNIHTLKKKRQNSHRHCLSCHHEKKPFVTFWSIIRCVWFLTDCISALYNSHMRLKFNCNWQPGYRMLVPRANIKLHVRTSGACFIIWRPTRHKATLAGTMGLRQEKRLKCIFKKSVNVRRS